MRISKLNCTSDFRSGKSSIQKVVFHKMSPNETLFLESTNKIVKDDINNSSFVQFQIWDFPGQIDFFDATFDSDTIFGGCGALVFVIDAQVGTIVWYIIQLLINIILLNVLIKEFGHQLHILTYYSKIKVFVTD